MIRSWLFVPGDSARKMEKAAGSPADVLILDLEDAVAAERTALARDMIREFLQAHPDRTRFQLWVRINPLSTPLALLDLAGVVPGRPDGILVPKTDGGEALVALGHYLSALETASGIPEGMIRTMPVATETALAMFNLQTYAGVGKRLLGLTWGAEDLAAAIGASTNRVADGSYEFTFRLARSPCLVGAVAAGVAPIDTVWTDFRDKDGLKADAEAARRAGFLGKLAIHPDQVEIINAAFTPSEADIAYAERVVAAFAQAGTGAVGLDGKMLDMPHLKQARSVLALAASLAAAKA
jgi:citrate lyase subunit beta/citryl-CoA lyase